MTRREVSPELASLLAGAVDKLDGTWNRRTLTEAFARWVSAQRAEELATRVVGLQPTEPVDRRTSLRALLTELPVLPRVIVPNEPIAKTVQFDVPALHTRRDVATLLNLRPEELDWFADRGGWLRQAGEPLSHYRYLRRPKSSGLRLIEAPKPRLREIQRTILRRVLANVPAHDACHGFEKGRSAETFASAHARSDIVVRVDLRDFFAGIGFARVRAVYVAFGYDESIAGLLAAVCTTATPVHVLRGLPVPQAGLLRVPHLPQGAPTSPRLANLIAHRVDRRVSGYAARNGLTYTRYADDLALSGPGVTDVDRVLWSVRSIVEAEGFRVNHTKTSVRRRHQRQTLAGLVVNSRPGVPRDTYDAMRAMLHNCARTGASAQNRAGHADFRSHVYGRIAWIGASSPARRQRLLDLADRVDWDR